MEGVEEGGGSGGGRRECMRVEGVEEGVGGSGGVWRREWRRVEEGVDKRCSLG